MSKNIIITIDGPAGVGKSTIAKHVGTKLGFPYLDTGAMFRTLALHLGPNLEDLSEDILYEECLHFTFQLKGTGKDSTLMCNNKPIKENIRSEKAGELAAKLSISPTVRKYMKMIQRQLGETMSLVVEGRDMGTAIFPNAQYKFFLDANLTIRAQRRFSQLQKKGETPNFTDIATAIMHRDTLDQQRSIAPLLPAPDAIYIDTSYMDMNTVCDTILNQIDL